MKKVLKPHFLLLGKSLQNKPQEETYTELNGYPLKHMFTRCFQEPIWFIFGKRVS